MSLAVSDVVLNSFQPALRFPREKVYFAFGDGELEYDCQACNAQCCRGHGFLVEREVELKTLVEVNPAVAWFAEPPANPAAKTVLIRNCPPGCFMLDQHGRCEVQNRRGYSAKPETCRLFPFNELLVCGDVLVVTPHRTLCPLTLVKTGSHSTLSSHDALWTAMTASGINAHVKRVSSGSDDLDATLATEQSIAVIARNHSDIGAYEDFAITQRSLEVEKRGRTDPATGGDAEFAKFGAHLRSALGGWPSSQAERDAELLRLMIAMTPTLRSWLLFPVEGGGDYLAKIRSERIPHLLLALHKLTALSCEAGMEAVTYQTISRLFHTYLPALTLLCFADCRMTMDFSKPVDLSTACGAPMHARFADAIRAFTDTTRPQKLTVGEILAGIAPDGATGRLSFLNAVANRLLPRLTLVEPARPSGRRMSISGWLQKTFVLSLDNRQLFRVVRSRVHRPG